MGFHRNVVLMLLVLVCSCMNLMETSVVVDIEALKAFKNSITRDSVAVLEDWIDDNHHCNWTGVACDQSSRVVSVSLPEKQLRGEISPFLGNLSSLQVLDLSLNSFTGAIPRQLGRCSALVQLVLYGNSLFGSIPVEMWYLRNLQLLDAGINDFNGTIPESFCNCTSLVLFGVDQNNMTGNQLSGVIPDDLYNCTNLRTLVLSRNSLVGPLKRSIGRLFRLTTMRFHTNSFSGVIPGEIGNLSQLLSLELARNKFSGLIPSEVSTLSFLQGLSLFENVLEGPIPASLSDAKQLVELQLQLNRLTGPIPDDLSKLKWLSFLDLHGNNLTGAIPRSMGSLNRILIIDLSYNRLTESIPGEMLAAMKSMQIYLNLSNNYLSGNIPEELGGLEMVQGIDISNNNLSGSIPVTIRGCKSLLSLDLSENALSNPIPGEIFSELDLLTSLNLSGNGLVGELPVKIANLRRLSSLDLSKNNLSGTIPDVFTNFTNLKYLNLSFNQLEGPVPTDGIFENLSLSSLSGNPALCGTGFLSPCNNADRSTPRRRFSKKAALILIILGSIFAFLVLVCAILVFHRYFRKQKTERGQYSIPSSLTRFSQKDLEIATNFFSESNVIGRSGSSTVYKGSIQSEQVVAVKKLNILQFSSASVKSFNRELDTLNRLRHRNLLKMIGYAWEPQFKALVLEYMENGSLESVIHGPGTDRSRWIFSERLKVCVSVANGMVYLHSDYGDPIVHCDLKPSNVLFDGNWEAHVSDFGTARILGVTIEDESGSSLSSAFQGTVGYLAPEFAYTSKVTTKADVFSFGVLVMEFLTTRRPTGTIEDNGVPVTLRQFVEAMLSNGSKRLRQVVDPELALSLSTQHEEEKMVGLLELAVSCTHPEPANRPDMSDVLSSLLKIRDSRYLKDEQTTANPSTSNT